MDSIRSAPSQDEWHAALCLMLSAGWVDWQIAADGGGIVFDSSGYRP